MAWARQALYHILIIPNPVTVCALSVQQLVTSHTGMHLCCARYEHASKLVLLCTKAASLAIHMLVIV